MKERSQSEVKGVDRGWSWVVALACCFGSLVLAGIFRTSGVLFVAFISTYGVSREEASWPMVVCIAVLNLTGPFSGILGQRFGVRPTVMVGAVIATIGISSCYLTTSLKVITILFGGVFGIGYGFINTLMPVILNAYFLNLRATANGIANSGSCVGSIILPIVFEYLISSYGLSGCFLLTGGIVLHLTIAGALMRPPPWIVKLKLYRKQQKAEYKCLKHADKTSFNDTVPNSTVLQINIHPKANCEEGVEHEISGYESKSSQQAEIQNLINQSNASESHSEDTGSHPLDSKDLTGVRRHEHKSSGYDCKNLQSAETQNLITQPDATDSSRDESDVLSAHVGNSSSTRDIKNDARLLDDKPLNVVPCLVPHRILSSRIFKSFVSVLTCPMFYITAVTNVCFYFLYHMYVVIIVDYALDRSVVDTDTKNILFAFSISDLFGRLCLGWITDRKYISRSRFVMLCMTMIGIVFFAFPHADGYSALIVISCVYGLLLGCTMVVFPILLVDFCGLELHAVAYGCMCFMNGFASFARPFLIGYFRDSIGSYSSIFYILGTLSIVASALWLLETLFNKKRNSTSLQIV